VRPNTSRLPSISAQWERAQSRPARIDREPGAFFLLRSHLTQGGDNASPDRMEADIIGSDLNNAGRVAMPRRQN
jgi:hypothetical protein